ncbi:ArsR/SmtB family transcription factor [Nocardioides sp.]|uniref:ArsR/SmtB family transcription factor n=1 Tax=Nocardioides sp. TaxID=35761 RepID=UPI002ED211D0
MTDDATQALRAIAHPLRLQILSLLTGTELSAAEVARELDVTHANASYHLRVLLDAGQLELASEERIRGGVAKRYRHPWRQPPRKGKVSSADREAYARAMAEELVRRARLAVPGRQAMFTDAELWVGDDDLAAVHAAAQEAATRLHDAAQPPRTPGAHRVALTLALFEMVDGEADS